MVHQFVPPTYKLCSEQEGCLLFQHLNVITTCKCEPSPQIWPDCSGSSEINGFLTTINSFPLSFFQLWPLKTFKALVIFHQKMQALQASPRRVFTELCKLHLICCSIHLNTFQFIWKYPRATLMSFVKFCVINTTPGCSVGKPHREPLNTKWTAIKFSNILLEMICDSDAWTWLLLFYKLPLNFNIAVLLFWSLCATTLITVLNHELMPWDFTFTP